jgi:hypothetical protein
MQKKRLSITRIQSRTPNELIHSVKYKESFMLKSCYLFLFDISSIATETFYSPAVVIRENSRPMFRNFSPLGKFVLFSYEQDKHPTLLDNLVKLERSFIVYRCTLLAPNPLRA